MKKPQGFLEERSLPAIEMTPGRLRYLSRRRRSVVCAGAVAALAGGVGFSCHKTRFSRFGCAFSKYGLPWEGVVSEQSTAYR